MKIAFIYDAVYPWETGGVQKRVWELACRLAERHDVHLYGQKYWDGDDKFEKNRVVLHGVCAEKELYVGDRRSITQPLYFASHLIEPLLKHDFDIIDCQAFPYFPCYVSKMSSSLNRTNLVITWYEVWEDYWYDYLGVAGVVGKVVEKTIAKLDAVHVVTSETTKEGLQSINGKNIELCPLGINYDEFQNVSPTKMNLDFLFIGRLIPEKNASLVVKAVDELVHRGHNVTATIIGEGPERERVEKLVTERGIQESVNIKDFVNRDELLSYMKAANALVFPSEREGFGLVAVEALACGTPVITSNHPQNAAQELVSHGKTGFVTSLNVNDIASAMSKSETIPPSSCYRFARQYDWANITPRIQRIYEKQRNRN